MLKASFWVEVATQQCGYRESVSAATTAEIINKIPVFMYDSYGLDPFDYSLKIDGKVLCEGTYDDIVEKLKRME